MFIDKINYARYKIKFTTLRSLLNKNPASRIISFSDVKEGRSLGDDPVSSIVDLVELLIF